MNKKRLIFSLIISFVLLWGIATLVSAQATTTTNPVESSATASSVSTSTDVTTTQDIEADENVSSEDLGLKDPSLLPDSPWYFAKNWWNNTKLFFTFNPIKKAQLRQKIVDQKILEIKKLVKKGENSEILDRAQKNYEKEQEKLRQRIEKINQSKDENSQALEKFKEKFVKHQILHDKILEKLESQVPEKAYEKIKTAREIHLQKFGEVMFKLDNKDDVPKRLENALGAIKGSEFKDFKNLEFLKNLQERVQDPDKKAKLEQAEDKITEHLKSKIEKMPEAKQLRINQYLENLPGDKIKHLEILQGVKKRFQDKKKIQERLEQGRQGLLERISKHQDNESQGGNKICPSWSVPAPGFCKNGRIVIKRDANGCPTTPICVSVQEIRKQIQGRPGLIHSRQPAKPGINPGEGKENK